MTFSSLLFAGRGTDLTSFFMPAYFAVFLPICLTIYSIVPGRGKKYVLLIADCVFFWLISGKLIIYLFLTAFSMHYFGIWLDRIQYQTHFLLEHTDRSNRKQVRKQQQSKMRRVVVLAVLLHIGVLFGLKYTAFFSVNINTLLSCMKISVQVEIPAYAAPIGISFFSLQALSYIFDVYRGVVKADANLLRLALYISFFPQITEGPICRYDQTAQKLWNVQAIRFCDLTFGLQRILYGMMKKIVIADRLNPLVKNVFDNYSEYDGSVIALAALCYTVQLYMDFSGAMDAAIGTGQIFGVVMPENFRQPFFSKTISEFWTRWHITLGAWFKDYVFYPITMSSPVKKLTVKARKKIGNHFGPLLAGSIALFCVWFFNGLWHGPAWHYIFFGMYHFSLILVSSLINPLAMVLHRKLHIRKDFFVYHLIQILRTACLVIIGEVIFRAESLRAGIEMIWKMVTQLSFSSVNCDLIQKLGVDWREMTVAGLAVIVVLTVSIINESGKSVRELLAAMPIALRWIVLYCLILFIVVFGAYGVGYTPVDPMYAQF